MASTWPVETMEMVPRTKADSCFPCEELPTIDQEGDERQAINAGRVLGEGRSQLLRPPVPPYNSNLFQPTCSRLNTDKHLTRYNLDKPLDGRKVWRVYVRNWALPTFEWHRMWRLVADCLDFWYCSLKLRRLKLWRTAPSSPSGLVQSMWWFLANVNFSNEALGLSRTAVRSPCYSRGFVQLNYALVADWPLKGI